jgi:GntR family transcriptional repressor for pyruvate dehydrogenase complex
VTANSSTLAAQLQRQILGGEIPPGGALPSERKLAERYRVSRSVVREVLGVLAERRLIEVVIGRGAFVRAPRTTDAARAFQGVLRRHGVTARQLVEARRLLESHAAELAAVRATDADLRDMLTHLEALEGADRLVERVRRDLAFHITVARAAHNPVLEVMFASIAEPSAELILRSLSDPATAAAGVPVHRRVYNAIRSGNPRAARSAMARHADIAAQTYGPDLDRDLDQVAGADLRHALGLDDADLDEVRSAVHPG